MKPDIPVRVLEENMSVEKPKDFREANGTILVTVGEREKAVMKKSAKDIIETNSKSIGVINLKLGMELLWQCLKSLIKHGYMKGIYQKNIK
nr:hypothetical protein [Peribacillus simplex]